MGHLNVTRLDHLVLSAADSSEVARERGTKSYVRFIVLCAGRTGSYMLTSSLNYSPDIVCFGEVFNWVGKHVDYRVEGYDMYDQEARDLRDEHLERFLAEKIFFAHPIEIGAVGFKAPHTHFWGQKKLLEWLVAERDIRVLHLRRRNMLRRLVSREIAVDTGVWTEYQGHALGGLGNLRNVVKAVRHPMRAAIALRRVLRQMKHVRKSPRKRLVLTAEECREFFAKEQADAAYYDDLFNEHDIHTLYYEDLVEHYTDTLNQAQAFLGLKPRPLVPATRKQNPEPLRDLIENYTELHDAFKGTPEEAFFDG